MESIGDDLDIYLVPEAGDGGEYRTNDPGFRTTVQQINHGSDLLSRANIVGVAHGTLAPNDDLATLLIFEFRFISMQRSRRFINCKITVKFEDSHNDAEYCPEVHKIAPEGVFALSKTNSQRDVKLSGSVGVEAGMAGIFSAKAGHVWDMAEVKNVANWTQLTGTRMDSGKNDKDDTILWSMSEDPATKSGIPSFLRGATLLRRKADVPFNLTMQVRAEVDFSIAGAAADYRSLFGKKKVNLGPVRVDSTTSPKSLKVATIDPNVVDLTQMDNLELAALADVTVITVLDR